MCGRIEPRPIARHWSEERKPAYVQGQAYREDLSLEGSQFNWIANFIWSIADDVLRDLYVRGRYCQIELVTDRMVQ